MPKFIKLSLGMIAVILVAASCKPEKLKVIESEPLGSLFIIGGGPRPDILAERMIEESGLKDGGYIVILPMASEVPDSAIFWSSEQFLNQGITAISGFNFSSGKPVCPIKIDSLSMASLIFISGGDQSRFMEIVRNTPIHQAIKDAYQNGAMIAGTSAGAAMMSQKMITGDQGRHEEYTPTYRVIENENIDLADGLGLISTAIIDQHFVWRSRHNRLITAVLEYPELPGIGIDESTAILVKGNTAEVVGVSQVIVFRNPKKSRKDLNEKIGGYDLTLDVFLPGDIFEIVK